MVWKPAKNLLQRSCLTALTLVSAVSICAQPPKAKPPKPDMPRSERHESKHEVDQLEESWRTAALHHDANAMDTLLSDDYIGIGATGTLQSKDEMLASLRAGTTQFTQIDLSDRKVRFYGKTALVTSRAEVTGTTLNGRIEGSFRYTRVYVRDSKGIWKVVSFEASRIRDTEDRK